MDNLPEDPEFDESRGYLFDESLSTTQERLMREMNEYLASISQLPIDADGSGEPSTIDDDSCSLSSGGGSLLERGRKYFAKEDKSYGEKAHPGSNNRAMVSIDEHVGHDDIAKEYEYYNDFDDDSVVAMAKRMDDVSILSDPSLICGPSEKILSLLPIPPLPRNISAGKSYYRGKFNLGKANGSNRTKVPPPLPPRSANDSQRPPHSAPPRKQSKQMNSISTEFKSKTNHEHSIPPRNPSCSPTHSKECIGVKQERHRRASSDSASLHRLGVGGEKMDSEQSRGEWVAAIGLHVATPKGKRSPKLAPASCEEGMKARRGSDSKLGETRGGDAGHKVTPKSGLKGTSPQVKRRLGKRNSKPKSDGDDDLIYGVGSNTRIHACKTKVDNEPKKVRGQPQSQSTKNPQMPPKGIEGRVRTYNNDGVRENDDDGENDSNESTDDDASIHVKAHAHKPLGNSHRPPRVKHSQRRHDQCVISECDEDSDTQTQFFYESTDDDEEELGAVGTSVADAVKDLNEKRVVTKVKNLFGIIF